ncbi:hypothetical protein FRC04_010719 [Tulasnella sp. 424]|nr:hypothetical protein FRC04_010719 [Tulasnella sp. 424]
MSTDENHDTSPSAVLESPPNSNHDASSGGFLPSANTSGQTNPTKNKDLNLPGPVGEASPQRKAKEPQYSPRRSPSPARPPPPLQPRPDQVPKP